MADLLARMRQMIGTTAQWLANNRVLGDGELGLERLPDGTARFKVGDGVKTFSALPYSVGAAGGSAANIGYSQAGAGALGRTVEARLREAGISKADFSGLEAAFDQAIASNQAVIFKTSATVRVPEHVATVQDVLLHAVAARPGVKITVHIDSGHQLATGIVLPPGDYSHFEITSSDATVLLATSWPANTCVLEGSGARMPRWSILVDCNSQLVGGGADGLSAGAITVRDSSELFVSPGCGVKNNRHATCAGIFVARSSICYAKGAVFTGSTFSNVVLTSVSLGYFEAASLGGSAGSNIRVYSRSMLDFSSADLSNAGLDSLLMYASLAVGYPLGPGDWTPFTGCANWSVYARHGSHVTLRERSGLKPHITACAAGIKLDGDSTGDFTQIRMTGIAQGLELTNASRASARAAAFASMTNICINASAESAVDCEIATFANCAQLVRAATGAVVSIASATKTGTLTGIAIEALTGGTVQANNATLPGATSYGISCDHATVYAPSIDVSGSTDHCVRAIGGTVDVSAGTCTGSGAMGCSATQGARVLANGTNFGAYTTNGINASQGSYVSAHGANARKTGSDAATDIVVASGSTIAIVTGTGGVSKTANTVTVDGIIYK